MVSGIQWEHSSRSLVRHADIVVRNIPMAYINDNGLGPDSDNALLATAADILESGAGPSKSQRGLATRKKLLWKPSQGRSAKLLLPNLYKEQEHLTDTLLAEPKGRVT